MGFWRSGRGKPGRAMAVYTLGQAALAGQGKRGEGAEGKALMAELKRRTEALHAKGVRYPEGDATGSSAGDAYVATGEC